MSVPVGVPQPLLSVEGLDVWFRGHHRGAPSVQVVDDVSLSISAGETLGLVGESGSGKTVTSLALAGLLRFTGGQMRARSAVFAGQDLTALDERGWSEVRGSSIGMVFQQPTRSLDPAFTVGDQIAEAVRRHRPVGKADARRQAVDMLDRVRLPNAASVARQYPHTLSGGMCQRAMIAMALACEPQLLIADEPTTALDVTVQAQILALLNELQSEMGIAILLITHDLSVVATMCDRVAVMYAGQIVENGRTDDLLTQPEHPYTASLIQAVPVVGRRAPLRPVPGAVPPAGQFPAGCRFHPRCAFAIRGRCDTDPVPLDTAGAGRQVRCVRADELDLEGIDAHGTA